MCDEHKIQNYNDMIMEIGSSSTAAADCKKDAKTDFFWKYHEKVASRLIAVVLKLGKRNLARDFQYLKLSNIPIRRALYKEFKKEIRYDLKLRHFPMDKLFISEDKQRVLLAPIVKKWKNNLI